MSETCAWVTERLPDHHAGRLAPEERAAVETHLAACAECAGTSRLIAALRGARVPSPPPARWARLADEVADRAARARAARRFSRPAAWRAAAGIVVLAGASALAWWLVGADRTPPWAAEEPPVAWEALMWTSGPPWGESALPGWFTLDDLSASELSQLLEEVEST